MTRRFFLRLITLATATVSFARKATTQAVRSAEKILTPAPPEDVLNGIVEFWQRRYSALVAEMQAVEKWDAATCLAYGERLLQICRGQEADGSITHVCTTYVEGNNPAHSCGKGTVLDVTADVPAGEQGEIWRAFANVARVAQIWDYEGKGSHNMAWSRCDARCLRAATCESRKTETLNPSDCIAQLAEIDKSIVRDGGAIPTTAAAAIASGAWRRKNG